MREYIKIVESSASRVLYHGTSIPNAAFILQSNKMVAVSDGNGPLGVSFTRSKDLAWSFAQWKADQEVDAIEGNSDITVPAYFSKMGAVLVFDRDLLAHDYELKTHQWNNLDDEEQEERLLGNVDNLSKYLIEILCDENWINMWAKLVAKAETETDIFMSGASRSVSSLAANVTQV
jgi:hypothetical protein